jgi:hypothetical protein
MQKKNGVPVRNMPVLTQVIEKALVEDELVLDPRVSQQSLRAPTVVEQMKRRLDKVKQSEEVECKYTALPVHQAVGYDGEPNTYVELGYGMSIIEPTYNE